MLLFTTSHEERETPKQAITVMMMHVNHHEKLRKLQSAFSYVRKSHVMIDGIDRALCSGDYTALLVLLSMNFEGLFYTADNDTDEHEQVSDLRIMLDNSMVIESLCKEVEDDPDKVCCCCEQLHQRKSVTKELNRLRKQFRPDLPLYRVPPEQPAYSMTNKHAVVMCASSFDMELPIKPAAGRKRTSKQKNPPAKKKPPPTSESSTVTKNKMAATVG